LKTGQNLVQNWRFNLKNPILKIFWGQKHIYLLKYKMTKRYSKSLNLKLYQINREAAV
jgi:hypothetical protein